MDSNPSGRRRFLKHAAALAGVAVGAGAGAEWAARGQSAKPEASPQPDAKDSHVFGHGEPSRFVKYGRGVRLSVDHITCYTPLQECAGIITQAGLHFVQQHSSHLPDIDPDQHRLTIHGMVDRPLSFTMEELTRVPSVYRIHSLECQENPSALIHAACTPIMGPPLQFVWGMTSCSEWPRVP